MEIPANRIVEFEEGLNLVPAHATEVAHVDKATLTKHANYTQGRTRAADMWRDGSIGMDRRGWGNTINRFAVV